MRRVGYLLVLGILLLVYRPSGAQSPPVITPENADQLTAKALAMGFNASQAVISPDGTTLALLTNQSDTEIMRLSLVDATPIPPLDGVYPLIHMFYGGDGRLYTTHTDGVARIWRDTSLEALFRHTGELRTVTADPQGATFATSATPFYRLAPQNAVIRLWDAREESPLWLEVVDTTVVTAFTFSPDGSLLVSGGSGYSLHEYAELPVHVWAVEDGDLLARLPGHTDNIIQVAFSPNGSLLATASVDGTILLWSVIAITEQGITAPLQTLQLSSDQQGDEVYLNSLAFSPAGDLLITAQGSIFEGESLRLWSVTDLLQGNEPEPLAVYPQELGIRTLVVSADGTKIITISDYEPDQGVWVWEIQ